MVTASTQNDAEAKRQRKLVQRAHNRRKKRKAGNDWLNDPNRSNEGINYIKTRKEREDDLTPLTPLRSSSNFSSFTPDPYSSSSTPQKNVRMVPRTDPPKKPRSSCSEMQMELLRLRGATIALENAGKKHTQTQLTQSGNEAISAIERIHKKTTEQTLRLDSERRESNKKHVECIDRCLNQLLYCDDDDESTENIDPSSNTAVTSTAAKSPSESSNAEPMNVENQGSRSSTKGKHIFVVDSGGGYSNVGTVSAWLPLPIQTLPQQYQSENGSIRQWFDDWIPHDGVKKSNSEAYQVIPFAVTKAHVFGVGDVIFGVHHLSLNLNEDEDESILIPGRITDIGGKVDDDTVESGGECGVFLTEYRSGKKDFLPLNHNLREAFFNISKPSHEDVNSLPCYYLNKKTFWSPEFYQIVNGRKINLDGEDITDSKTQSSHPHHE